MQAFLLEGEKVGDPVRSLCHPEFLEGGSGLCGVCDGRLVEVEEVDRRLRGRRPGLWRPSSLALAPSGRRIEAWGRFAGWWALGWAWWGEALAPLWGEFPGLLGAPVGLVLGGDAPDGWALLSSKVWPSGFVRGASALVELLLAVPGHPDLYPLVWARVLEAVLDRALTPDPVAPVVVAARLLDLRAFLELWVCFGLGRCVWRKGG